MFIKFILTLLNISNSFGRKIEEELTKVNAFCQKEYETISDVLNSIARRIIHLLDQTLDDAVLNKQLLEKELDDTSQEVINLEKFVSLCSSHFIKVVK